MFIQARNFTRGRPRPIRVIVWHDMEANENANTAENVAGWFGGSTAPRASAHVCVDSDSVVECVKPADTAWHAPGANDDGYGIELAGFAGQTSAEWNDAYSRATITNAANWVAPIMRANGIPPRWLTDAELADRRTKGMTTHVQVSRVFKQSDHHDPGPNFPMDFTAAAVAAALNPPAPVVSVPVVRAIPREDFLMLFRDARNGAIYLVSPAKPVQIATPADVLEIERARAAGDVANLSAGTCDRLLAA